MRIYQLGEFHGDVIHSHRIDDVVFGITRRAKGETVPLHSHNHASIRALIKGDHHYISESGSIFHSLPSTWYYAEPNEVHTHEACRTDIISIGIQYPAENYMSPTIARHSHLKGAAADFTLNLIQSHLTNRRETSRNVLINAFHLLRAILADEGQLRNTSIPSWLSQAKQQIDESYLGLIRVDALSQVVGVHPSHMARAFRSEFGQTITAYVRDRRLEWSINEIKTTTQKLGSIAVLAGFSDQAHFTREFKKRYGQSPSAFR